MPLLPDDALVRRHQTLTTVRRVRVEIEAGSEPESAAVVTPAVTWLIGWISELVVVAIYRWEFLATVMPKRVANVSREATDVKAIVVALWCNVEVAVLGVAVLTFPVKQVDT